MWSEDVTGIAIKGSNPLPPPPMCLMAKGGTKKKKKKDPRKCTWDEATDSDSDGECEEVMTVESLLPKLNCVTKQLLKEHEKVKALTRSNKELMMGLKEYDESYKELRTKYETLTKDHDNLLTRHKKLSLEHEELKVSHKKFECSLNEKAPSNTPSSHDGSTCVAKIDASTSCLDLLTMPYAPSCDNVSTLEANF